MLPVLGAAAYALDALQSLTSSKSSSPPTGFGQPSASPFDVGNSSTASASGPTRGTSGSSQISPSTMSALLAAQGQSSAAASPPAATSRSGALQDLFSLIDGDGNGTISKSEFEQALGAGGTNLSQADDVFSKMDRNGDGAISLDEMLSALKGGKGHHRHHHVGGADGSGEATDAGGAGNSGSSSDPLLQALNDASSSSVNNSDGSTTTSVTYADGSKVTMTSPAAKTSSGTATSSYNFIEQMIQREAQAISARATPSLSLNV
jgi:EF-hand domain pair